MRVEADQLGLRPGVSEERFGVAGAFRGDRGDPFQRIGGTRREIAEVSEWRRDDIEGARHVTTSPARGAGRRIPPPAAHNGARASHLSTLSAPCPASSLPLLRAAEAPNRSAP